MKDCDRPLESIEPSSFQQGLIQIQQYAGQYCSLEASAEHSDSQSWWQNLYDLFVSGKNNFGENYSDLLFSGEIGAVFMVALVPLFLGLFIEAALIISYKRKDQQFNSDRRIQLIKENKGLLNQALEQNKGQQLRRYTLGYGFVFTVQFLLLGFFLIVGPQYDRDVWCNENRTQVAILKAGIETENLQADQRKANCEIRQAVSTLQNLFSKENKNTVNNIKKVSGQLDNSVKKLDKANASIDDFKVKIEEATENTEDVLKTLTIMKSIAAQLGINQNNGPLPQTKNLPELLRGLETLLNKQPDQTWISNQLLSKQEFTESLQKAAQAENSQSETLQELSGQQALLAQQLEALSQKMVSPKLVEAISKQVADRIAKQNLFQFYPATNKEQVIQPIEADVTP